MTLDYDHNLSDEDQSRIAEIARRFSKKAGLSEYGEDLAQDALTAVLVRNPPPDHPVAYAITVIRRGIDKIIKRIIDDRNKKAPPDEIEKQKGVGKYLPSIIREINECVDSCCVNEPDDENLKLLIDYKNIKGKQDRRHRENLAETMKTTYGALKTRINRMLIPINKCVRRCCEGQPNLEGVIANITTRELNRFIKDRVLYAAEWSSSNVPN